MTLVCVSGMIQRVSYCLRGFRLHIEIKSGTFVLLPICG